MFKTILVPFAALVVTKLSLQVYFGVIWCTYLKNGLSRRVNGYEIWDSGTLVTPIWGRELVVFKVILVSFAALVSKSPISPKRMVAYGEKFMTRGF